MSHRVAVYGTLKRSFGNHVAISDTNGKHVADSMTEDLFLMLDCGFPMVIWDTADHELAVPINVEVYDVNDESLRWMDGIEGHPDFYERKEINVHGVDGPVWMYFILDIEPGLDIIETGRWNPRLNHYREVNDDKENQT